jgi:hypothetical protein
MKKVAIRINYQGEIYQGDFEQFSYDDIKEIEEALESCAEGNATYMGIQSGNVAHYFPGKLLSKCIISLVFGDNNQQ